MAIDACLDATYLARLEKGSRQPPRRETLNRLSVALNASVDEDRVLIAAALRDHAIECVSAYLENGRAALVLEILEHVARLPEADMQCIIAVVHRLGARS